MQYIHIKDLAEYQPGYTDRTHIWAKIHYRLYGKTWFQELCEIDRGRYISLIVREVFHQEPTAMTTANVSFMGWDTKKRSIFLTLQMLHTKIDCVGKGEKVCATEERRVEEKREEKKREEKQSFGKEFQKVKLTEKEFAKLTEKFGDRTALLIDNLDSALASKGYKYASHYATILNWERRDAKPDSPQKTKLFPLSGKTCGQAGCSMPAVHKSAGEYDHFYCLAHSPQAVQDKYRS